MDSTTTSPDQGEHVPVRAGRREWLGLAVLALPTLLISIDMTVLHLATPHLSADLRPTSTQLLWITDIYGFLIAGFLITMGNVGDRIGRRRLLLIGAAAFGVASVLAAFSTSAEMLIAARAGLGLAGATLMPSTLSLIRNMFPDPRQRTTAIGLWMMSFSIGATAGPLVGGVLLDFFWWGSVFLAAVPVMVLLVVVGPVLLPEYRSPAPDRLDLVSAVLSLAAVLTLIYGLKELAAGDAGTVTLGAIAVGAGLGVVFVRRQRRLTTPMLDLALFRQRAFSASLGTLTLVILVGPGLGFLLGQYLQLVLGMSPLEAGLWSLPASAGIVVGLTLVPLVLRRVRHGLVTGVGLAAAAAGVFLMVFAEGPAALGLLVAGQTLFFVGASPMLVVGTDLIVGSVPVERSGAASALSETAQEFGAALGLAVLGSVASAVYRAQVTVPADLPAHLAVPARDTLGGATAAAAQLPGPAAQALLGPAQQAFTSGLQTAAGVAAAVLVGAAALAAVLFRRPTVNQ
ncbi:MFS transporter [Amycolatopsis suaedae]|uniref:MFS transporter n=1 Tax=Amycolatopsis suaedae TaxID=2510978 RepID=A0A4Q7JFL4_9PSEU|nr:MFS transporter [Amycolatopsis suaedae]RZQ66002.1 MFS transporter [Amycolatopsis suaedae]